MNGAPGLAIIIGDRVDSVIVLTFRDERITRVDIIRAPDKVRAATGGWIRSHRNRPQAAAAVAPTATGSTAPIRRLTQNLPDK